MKKTYVTIAAATLALCANAQYTTKSGNDATTPLHALKPDYVTPYGAPPVAEVKAVLDRVFTYLDKTTPAEIVHKKTNAAITDLSKPDTNAIIKPGDYRLTSYEWGVTYSGMLRAGETTGDKRYTGYTIDRVKFLADVLPFFKSTFQQTGRNNPLRQMIDPKALDDAGAVCAAMIKSLEKTPNQKLRPIIDNYIEFITKKEHRLADGTLARNRPQTNTLWLDDMYMGVPAMAQMGKLTGDIKYFDDAVKQVKQFTERMFNKQKGVYMHGWVEGMDPHPQFHWARANGWAIMTMCELLDVLPESHPGRAFVLEQLKTHATGLLSYQSGFGFWHQLLDRTDSYLETSATAIYAYCLAHACNKGWLDAKAFAPAAVLAWNAVSTKVNALGQVEGTCVGTGMAFDPAFYYYRPVNVFAAHSYGPVLLAGAEIIELINKSGFKINDSSLQYYAK